MALQDGATPVVIAAQRGHKECIEALAELGGDVNKAHSVSVHRVAHTVGLQLVVVQGVDTELLLASVAVLCTEWLHADLHGSGVWPQRLHSGTGKAGWRCQQGR